MATAAPGQQTTNLNEITLSELTDLVRRNWIYTKQMFPHNAKQLYLDEFVGAGQGSSKRFKEVDTETFADVKQEGQNSSKARVGIGYEVDMTARTFSKELDITLEMRNDNRYTEVQTYITDLNAFCENRMELDLTHRFTFATSTAYTDRNGNSIDVTTGDGLALLSASHTLAFSSTTYSNLVTGAPAFSQTSFEAAKLIAATQIYSNFGDLRQMTFNTIITGSDPSTQRAVKQLLQSTADVDGVQSGLTNVYEGAMKYVILPYIATTAAGAYDSTKRRIWFVAATGQGVNGWQAYIGTWIAPTPKYPASGNNGEDIHNYNWTFSAYCRYGIAVVSPKGVIGSFVVS